MFNAALEFSLQLGKTFSAQNCFSVIHEFLAFVVAVVVVVVFPYQFPRGGKRLFPVQSAHPILYPTQSRI